MTDREKVIRGLECCSLKECDTAYPKIKCPYVHLRGEYEDAYYECTSRLAADAHVLLREQDEERTRIVSWLGKFCAHVDQRFQPLPDEQNIEFFREKMKQQFGWEVSRNGAQH